MIKENTGKNSPHRDTDLHPPLGVEKRLKYDDLKNFAEGGTGRLYFYRQKLATDRRLQNFAYRSARFGNRNKALFGPRRGLRKP